MKELSTFGRGGGSEERECVMKKTEGSNSGRDAALKTLRIMILAIGCDSIPVNGRNYHDGR